MKISKHAVLYTAGVLAFSGLFLQLLGFVYRILLSRTIGAEGMGVYQLIFPVVSVVMSVSLSGISMAVSKLSAQNKALGQHSGLSLLLITAFKMFLLLSFSLNILIVLFSKGISEHLLGDIRVRPALFLLPLYLVLTGIENIHKACFNGIRRTAPVVVSEICELIIRIAAVLLLLSSLSNANPQRDAFLIVLGMILSEIFSVSFLFLFARKTIHKNIIGKPGRSLWKKIYNIALPVSAAGIINSLLSSANSVLIPKRLMVSGMEKSQALKSFGLLTGMLIPLFLLPYSFIGSLSSVLIPKLSEGTALKDHADIRRKSAKALHATSLMALPVIMVLIPLSGPLFHLFYRQQIPAKTVIPLALGSMLGYYESVCCSILYGIGLQKKAAVIFVLGEIIQLLFTYFTAARPGVGIHGYLAGYAVSGAVLTALSLYNVIRHTGLKLRMKNWFFIPFICALLSGFVADQSYQGFCKSGVSMAYSVILSIFAAFTVYIMSLSLLGLHPLRYMKTLIPLERKQKKSQ